MIEEWATVARVDADQVWLRADRRQGCARCEAGQGCGGGLLGKLVGSRDIQIAVSRGLSDVQPGDAVVIGFPESALLGGSLIAYALPLTLMICGAALASWLIGGDAAAAAGAVCGGALGWWLGRHLAPRLDLQPRLLRRAGTTDTPDCWAQPD